jgi:hypothetical protein
MQPFFSETFHANFVMMIILIIITKLEWNVSCHKKVPYWAVAA